MSEIIEKAILAEVEPGKHYLIAVKRGSVPHSSAQFLLESLEAKDIHIYFLETYDNPADCLLFNAKKEEVVNA